MNNVLELRTTLGMTQDEFAEYCDVSRISIARYETGGKVSRASAEKIAAACKVSVSFVIGDTKKAPAQAPPLSDDEIILLDGYRSLSKEGKAYMLQTLAMAQLSYPKKNLSVPDLADHA